MLMTTLIAGLVLGGSYALLAMGLTIQYGIARTMNLAYGETIIASAFAAYLLYNNLGISPILGLVIIAPAGFVFGWLVYGILMRPLVARSENTATLEINSILATFGLLFVIQGVMLVIFGGNYISYNYLNFGVEIIGVRVAANRLLALGLALTIGGGLYLLLTRTRWGTTLRAVAVNPAAAPLVGIDANRAARFAFALGGALASSGGVVVSMYQTFTASSGVIFTMKALIVVIMGGVGNLAGALFAGLILGLSETFVAAYISPGLTIAAVYIIFLVILLCRPAGLFGKVQK
ncbi:branched-chain amino acid ABC transporter permease [Ahrensia kielensis]|uniref:branched-chain amino acid ABC transporter permease n=1 Tax=Ahrensia kielensis TaxID=76980 RepID=UPI00037FA9F8|nr:branched-chain amino acid ABC transporter permease [Ahrensia kielensis]